MSTGSTETPATSSTSAAVAADVEGTGPAPTRRARGVVLIERSAVGGTFVVMVALFCIFASSTFVTSGTIHSILDQCAVPVILVSGLTLVLSVGEFDLSFTSTIGLSAGIVVVLIAQHGWAIWLAIIVVLVASLIIGLVVGLLVTRGNASSFIVTLAIGSAVTGLELATTKNQTIFNGIPTGYASLTSSKFLSIHDPDWLALVILVVMAIGLHRTRIGRHAQAIGGNSSAAYLAGIKVGQVRVLAFAILAVLAGVTGVILTSQANSYYPDSAGGYLLNSYAAAFLGASVGRWRGFTVFGAGFGVLWLVVLQTGLTQINAPTWLSSFIQGVVLAIAVLVASRGRKVVR